MKINFIIPNIPGKPTGGYKVMYEYANCFAEKEHDVVLYHVATVEKLKYNIPHWLRMLRTRLFYSDSKPKWFHISDKVKTINIPHIESKYIREADINILTQWAEVLDYSKLGDSKGKRLNLIQGYETWFSDMDDLYNSYKTGAKNVVISSFLADIVEKVTGERPPIVKNSINPIFQQKTPTDQRPYASVAMLYSEHVCKGSSYGIEALKIAKKEVPQLQVEMFGTFNPPSSLPDWIHYHKEPKDLCGLYNSVQIYMSPSVNDGWDLPCTEAMKCGCALLCTDIAGHKEYAREGETAFLAPAEDANKMAERLVELITDADRRNTIIAGGVSEAEKYTLSASYSQLENIIGEFLNSPMKDNII
ncbi:MAG: glycosyltransferase family 4 protein [Paludibacteraceae bacterium]|nr:glycosyltransferase family 4 protein [Paludibacteraceae bacterium]